MTAAKDALYGDRKKRPPRPPFNGRAIPPALRAIPNWVAWRYAWKEKDSKWTKLPLDPNRNCNRAASHADPATWADLNATVRATEIACQGKRYPERVDGLGFAFKNGDGLFGLDIDGCRNPVTGEFSPLAVRLIAEFATYTEVSPSMMGVKLFGRGALPGRGRKVKLPDGQELELYDRTRYFTVTGQRVEGTPEDVVAAQPALDRAFAEFFAGRAETSTGGGAPARPLSDDDIIDLVTKRAKNAAEGARLWAGDTSGHGGDDSAADLALCNLLAFYCGADPDRIDSLFRRSGLMRDKWERGDYRAATVGKSLAGRTEFFNPDRGRTAVTSTGGGRGRAKRVEVVIGNNEYAVNTAVIAAVVEDPDVFVRAGSLVRVIQEPETRRHECSFPAGPRIVSMSAPSLREYVSRCVEFVQIREEERVSVHPPDWAICSVKDRGVWPGARPLEAVVDHPVISPDGSVLSAPGYDAATGVFVNPIGVEIDVPTDPSRTDALTACATLDEVIRDFPFATEAHRSTWLAGLLTPLARFAFSGPSPLFLADGNIRGSGKGLLCNTINLIVTGKDFATSAFTNDDDEMRKRITALASEGDRMVLLDNINGRFGGSSLDRALTSTAWKDRELGKTKIVQYPLWATWYGTGNNIQTDGDTARRVARMRILSKHENPEDRTDIVHKKLGRWVLENRPRLLSAALTILVAYMRAGRPKKVGMKPWGSYEGWSDLIREAVVWCGRADPGDTRIDMREDADIQALAMATIVRNWHLVDPTGSGITCGQFLGKVFPKHGDTPEILLDVAEAVNALISRREPSLLGFKFRHFRKRPFGSRQLDLKGMSAGSNRWGVSNVDGGLDGGHGGDDSDSDDGGGGKGGGDGVGGGGHEAHRGDVRPTAAGGSGSAPLGLHDLDV